MYYKDFDNWNKLKKNIDKKSNIFFNEREIWICNLGVNIGSEEDGKKNNFIRPILIIRKFNKRLFLGIPLTSSEKDERISIKLQNINFLKKVSYILLHQMRALDSKRLYRKLGKLSKKTFKKILKKSALVITRASGT